ncbi:alpha/beta fold hydrolase [Deinococcus radiopugnans]|uniref:Alpha/beta hydrolase n=1 Tax=Deinococcus radiopugnans ATCC 19172 TaxID=585398 RepID=A0A5C4Y7W0_9DEIO|nr:alpha/beta hydrolase [Deinococcus radiopugnans]MBB6014947.1 pimeloyl-ACP methyl ester carboxylesterase [Deinococcus radiopugnans ATCC 19172]TNM71641.1 alpha/beta hydrolase [Deinococcus radiopugnans ATCC 19172]
MKQAHKSKLALTLTLLSGAALAGGNDGMRQEGMLAVNGAQIHYVSQGSGTPMLLLHGYPLSGELFSRNRDALANAGYRVITIDHRGYGQSVAPADDAGSIQTYAKDALAVMDQLNVPSAIIGGMSMGGPIVFEMYRTAPERFKGMLLIDTIANPANVVEKALWGGMAQKAVTYGPQSLVGELLKDMLTGVTRLNKPGDVKFLGDIVRQASVAGDVAGAKALSERLDSLPTLASITVPTLILEGVEDTVYPPPFAMKMQQNIAGSKLVLIPGAAHAAIYENAPAANRAILDWASTLK